MMVRAAIIGFWIFGVFEFANFTIVSGQGKAVGGEAGFGKQFVKLFGGDFLHASVGESDVADGGGEKAASFVAFGEPLHRMFEGEVQEPVGRLQVAGEVSVAGKNAVGK